ncbi:protein PRRC1-like isoform X2 [Pyrgilauda ruficollis]|uniref:protein PRRC1-like isoform X2 n=1 Tax=Pyrgilauda ruficollis TaxID=221976 RepID=UPI001B868E17|nr:protein PRRC1-like isoform X2 [Pyrgilauda ruficollis]
MTLSFSQEHPQEVKVNWCPVGPSLHPQPLAPTLPLGQVPLTGTATPVSSSPTPTPVPSAASVATAMVTPRTTVSAAMATTLTMRPTWGTAGSNFSGDPNENNSAGEALGSSPPNCAHLAPTPSCSKAQSQCCAHGPRGTLCGVSRGSAAPHVPGELQVPDANTASCQAAGGVLQECRQVTGCPTSAASMTAATPASHTWGTAPCPLPPASSPVMVSPGPP